MGHLRGCEIKNTDFDRNLLGVGTTVCILSAGVENGGGFMRAVNFHLFRLLGIPSRQSQKEIDDAHEVVTVCNASTEYTVYIIYGIYIYNIRYIFSFVKRLISLRILIILCGRSFY